MFFRILKEKSLCELLTCSTLVAKVHWRNWFTKITFVLNKFSSFLSWERPVKKLRFERFMKIFFSIFLCTQSWPLTTNGQTQLAGQHDEEEEDHHRVRDGVSALVHVDTQTAIGAAERRCGLCFFGRWFIRRRSWSSRWVSQLCACTLCVMCVHYQSRESHSGSDILYKLGSDGGYLLSKIMLHCGTCS